MAAAAAMVDVVMVEAAEAAAVVEAEYAGSKVETAGSQVEAATAMDYHPGCTT